MVTTSKEDSITERSLDLTIPYYISELARRGHEDLQVGDYVRVSGLDGQYELMDIMWKYGSVRIRQVGQVESMTMPWTYLAPLRNEVVGSKTALKAVGDWLFKGSRVYLLCEPGVPLRVTKIHWDRATSDLQDGQGRVYKNVSWNDIDFWDDVDYHLPDDEPN